MLQYIAGVQVENDVAPPCVGQLVREWAVAAIAVLFLLTAYGSNSQLQ